MQSICCGCSAYITLGSLCESEITRYVDCRYGVRNSLLIAPMPTASTAQILGNCESFEPYTSNIYTRRVLSGEFQVITALLYGLKDWSVFFEFRYVLCSFFKAVWVRGHCRINPPLFLAECCKRRLNQCSFVLLYFRLSTLFDLYLIFVWTFSCTVFVYSFCMSIFLYSFVSISQVIGCEDRLRNDLYCVRWGDKLCSLTHILIGWMWLLLSCREHST